MRIRDKIRKDPRVERVYEDSDGMWADLKAGFVKSGDAHCHHEYTWADLYRSLKENTAPCVCQQCLMTQINNLSRQLEAARKLAAEWKARWEKTHEEFMNACSDPEH